MKNISVSTILAVVLCILILAMGGCSHLGRTEEQVHRDHIRNVRLNQQQLVEDIDTFLLIDEPSKLTDKRIP